MDQVDTVLRERFGFSSFLPGQREACERLLAGRSVLAVFPTGGGKSLCFQLPALLLDGLTLVISPLIALMKDQVDALARAGVAAARLDSTLSKEAVFAIQDRMADGSLKLLYVAPERLASERFLARLKRVRISLLAIDEAHCISEWGHNFRPDYLRLQELARSLGVERVLALTATATPAVAADIRAAFAIAPDDHVATGFYRPNLELGVTRSNPSLRPQQLLARLAEPPHGPTIVYVTLQRTAEEVARLLQEHGHRAEAYHAGMKNDRRHQVQDAFMAGRTDAVVATIAFGMGIDKADIRRVYHYNLPKTLENYVQEVGRAGRDGEPARCELIAVPSDEVVLANFSYGDTPDPESMRAMVAELLGQGERFDVSRYDLSVRHDIRPLVVATALAYLELGGALVSTGPFYSAYKVKLRRPQDEVVARFNPVRQRFLRALFASGQMGRTWLTIDLADAADATGGDRERVVAALDYLEGRGELELQVTGLRHGYRRLGEPDATALAEQLVERFTEREKQDLERVRGVVRFSSEPGCLTRRLIAYFGEELGRDCGHCSACAGRDGTEPPSPAPPPPAFGDGELAIVREVAAEGHEALARPRQLTRFLCGLTSPAATRARLSRHPRFGALLGHPFADVLAAVEHVCHRSPR